MVSRPQVCAAHPRLRCRVALCPAHAGCAGSFLRALRVLSLCALLCFARRDAACAAQRTFYFEMKKKMAEHHGYTTEDGILLHPGALPPPPPPPFSSSNKPNTQHPSCAPHLLPFWSSSFRAHSFRPSTSRARALTTRVHATPASASSHKHNPCSFLQHRRQHRHHQGVSGPSCAGARVTERRLRRRNVCGFRGEASGAERAAAQGGGEPARWLPREQAAPALLVEPERVHGPPPSRPLSVGVPVSWCVRVSWCVCVCRSC